MTVFYLDTEFNGHGGQLISIALVSPTGEKFYGVLNWTDLSPLVLPWVKENVIPKLNSERRVFFNVLRDELQRFLIDYDNPEIICDWHKDAVHFLNLLEGPDYSSSLDYACRITVLKTPADGPMFDEPS